MLVNEEEFSYSRSSSPVASAPMMEEEDNISSKRFKRFRNRHGGINLNLQEKELKEKAFLRDLHLGFLPDDCESEFSECFGKLATDSRFASKCFRLALLSRNEDLLRVLLDHLIVNKDNFGEINNTFLDSLLLPEAVELDDLESIQGILAWRDAKASQLGLEEKEVKRFRSQEVIVAAAVRNNYNIVKLLFADGYKISTGDSAATGRKKLFGQVSVNVFLHQDMESHIDRIRTFKATSSPAYMAMTYPTDPVELAFDYTERAETMARREPEFKSEYSAARDKCCNFAVSILDSCRNSTEVEMVLNGNNSNSRSYARLYRALEEEQKEFVSHPYCQVLLHSKWLKDSPWSDLGLILKVFHVFIVILLSPIICPIYILTPFRDHSHICNPWGWFLQLLDRPINRFILDMTSYCIFLSFLLLSVVNALDDHRKRQQSWYFTLTTVFVVCYSLRLVSHIAQYFAGRISLNKFRFCYDLATAVLFIAGISFKTYGYEVSLKHVTGGLLFGRTTVLDVYHPINVGANIYGLAAALAFLKVIFLFEIHYRIGPILYCIKNVFWDVLSIALSFLVSVLAFSVGLVSIFDSEKDSRFSTFYGAFKTLFWIIFDPGKEEYADPTPNESDGCCCKSKSDSTITPNKSAFGGPLVRPSKNFTVASGNSGGTVFATLRPPGEEGDTFGLYIWAFYQVFVVLIMLNLLISLMTTTFARIQRNADREWKFSRASTWIHYCDDMNALPPPFNIIPSVYSLLRLYCWLKSVRGIGSSSGGQRTLASSLLMSQESKRRLYDSLLERVFRSEEKKHDSSGGVGRVDLEALEKEVAIDVADLRRDVRNLRRDLNLGNNNNNSNNNNSNNNSNNKRASNCNDMDKNDKEEKASKSFKTDNNREVVLHLVQTLGLEVGETSTAAAAAAASTSSTLEKIDNRLQRHRSIH